MRTWARSRRQTSFFSGECTLTCLRFYVRMEAEVTSHSLLPPPSPLRHHSPPAPIHPGSCKPYLAESILSAPGISAALEGKLLVSVLAGSTIAQLQGWVPASCTVVRAMPNTPAKVSPPPSPLPTGAQYLVDGGGVQTLVGMC